MPRKMSEAARRAISEAAKARWARYRAAKKSGNAPMTLRVKGKRGKRGRPKVVRGAAQSLNGGAFGGHSIDELVSMRRRIDQELADRLVRQAIGV